MTTTEGSSSSSSKEPVAGLSAASSCIRLSVCDDTDVDGLNSSSFRPVFTHQCFNREFIPGWRPLISAEEQSRQIYQSWKDMDDNGELHTSYEHCGIDQVVNTKDNRLDVHIVLSCDKCQVNIQTLSDAPSKINNDATVEPPPTKKQKHVSFAGVSKEEDDNLSEGKQPQMDIKDIVHKISSALPPIGFVMVNGTACTDLVLPKMKNNNASTSHHETKGIYLAQPIGKLLHKYTRKIKNEEEEAKFIITLADGSNPSVANYHNKVQPLARWYIETADDVDLTDDTKGCWKVMYLFREHTPSSLSLAGYITLLEVNSPFRKPKAGTILRICQALIMPWYHRAGHGSTMLQCVYKYADTNTSSFGDDILEINVEDPAPAFVALRDAVDYQRFAPNAAFKNHHPPLPSSGNGMPDFTYLGKYEVTDKDYFLPIQEETLVAVAEYLKITKRQCQIVHEINKLAELESWKRKVLANDDSSSNNHELIVQAETQYRLMVKKSLRQLRMEELGACGSKEEQKSMLGKWFDETLVHYRRVLKSSHVTP